MFALFPDPSGSWVPKGTYEYTVYVVLPLIGVRWSDVDEKKLVVPPRYANVAAVRSNGKRGELICWA